MKCLVVYNPLSGKGKFANSINLVHNRLKEKFDVIDIFVSKDSEDFKRYCVLAAREYDYLLFSGGDGTFNMVVNAIIHEEKKPILAYIPSGTCNDIAKDLNLPKNINKCLNIILKNDFIYHDVNRANDKYFMYVAALGDFASLSYNTNHNLKKMFGRIAYYFNGLRMVLKGQHNMDITLFIDGEEKVISTPLVLALNSLSIAGLKFNKKGYLNDGKLDLLIVKGKYLRGLLNVFNLFIFGILNIQSKKVSNVYHLEKFKIRAPSYSLWSLDGEEGDYGEVDFECLHNKIKVISNH